MACRAPWDCSTCSGNVRGEGRRSRARLRATRPDGQDGALSDYRGRKPVVLYFYPKDDTPGLHEGSCAFRDQYQDFQDAGAEVIGVSSDSEARTGSSQRSTGCRSPRVRPRRYVRKQYGVPATLGLLPGRVTYVIDREGTVRHVFNSQFQATQHVAEALQALRGCRSSERGRGRAQPRDAAFGRRHAHWPCGRCICTGSLGRDHFPPRRVA
jgi:peroxiredoxin Q/BCP